MGMIIQNQTFDEERALYGSVGLTLDGCTFAGPADGESALKESSDITAVSSRFDLRYPFWHNTNLQISECALTEKCRAPIWYSTGVTVTDTEILGIKCLRECSNVQISRSRIVSPEFGWSINRIRMEDSVAEGEYFMMRSEKLDFRNVKMKGKYSFQYISDSIFEDCELDTKDAFWHAKNVTIRNSVVKGEYLAWYSENVTFENCVITGTQPLCYCKGLKLIHCEMRDADLAFEKSEVDADITSPVVSIKNPRRGTIRTPAVEEIIMDDKDAEGKVVCQ